MKRILPIFFAFIFVFTSLFSPNHVFAQTPTPGGQQMQQNGQVPAGNWVIDKEVTFIGKNAARSGNLLDFTLRNYNWVCVTQNANGQCDDNNNPLLAVWLSTVQFIVAPLLFIVIITTSIIVIVTRGRSLTITRFIPRFIAVLLLIFLSFGILRFFYIFTDVIQGFFLRPPDSALSCPPKCISQNDLLFVGWDYETFIGLRLLGGTGEQNAEAAFITLLLTKLTALTYFVMVGILFLRKIILWLFIIVAPIFPLLLLFYPIRNTGKIWIGEFFRWLLYAPLFAIFLKGLVSLWRDKIPLFFGNPNIGVAGKEIYPTAVNILLGGPKEFVTPTNSVNLTETFALYVVSLIMLWGVIILPWILLQIFLDYASNMAVGDSMIMKNLVSKISNLQNPPGGPARSPTGDGAALNLPFAKKFNLPINPSAAPTGSAKAIPMPTSVSNVNTNTYMPSAQVKAQTLSLTNLSIPSLRDIAKYDTSLISKDSDRQKETIIIQQNLEKIGNPTSSTSSTERERYTEIREKLTQESKSGNTLATSILSAANTISSKSARSSNNQIKSILSQIANPALATVSTGVSKSLSNSKVGSATSTVPSSVINQEKLSKMNESLVKARKEGNSLAASILAVSSKTSDLEIEKLQERIMDAKAKGEPIASQIADITKRDAITKLPVVNRVQTVSSEDYKAVKDMWKENYRNLEVPEGMSGTRVDWVKEDMSKIEAIIALLNSKDEEQVNQGMNQVASILPFLLVGGFSQAEITSYLSAKLEAARDIAAEIVQDEDDKVSVNVKKTATTSQTMTASIPDDSNEPESDISSLSSAPASPIASNASQEILSLLNIKLPKISDIARYEAIALQADKSKASEVDSMHEIIKNIGNPENGINETEKARYKKIRDKIVEESQKGSVIAQAILSAADGIKAVGVGTTPTDTKTVLSQIANPSLTSRDSDKKRFTALNEQLVKAGKEGNTLASTLLSVKETATEEEIEKLTTQIKDEKTKGDLLATSVLSNITSPVSLPSANRIQTVSQEDYKAVKDLWSQNYQNLEVPQGLAGSRAEWIKDDIKKIGDTVNMLSSGNVEEQRKGMNEVANVLPFLLVGGFSQAEIVSYLQAKQEAAKETLVTISQEEDRKITINTNKVQTQQQAMAATREEVIGADSSSSTGVNTSQSIALPQVSQEILQLANIQLPNLRDIVHFETKDFTKDKSQSERIEQIQSVLEKINNPTGIVSVSEREKYEVLREKLTEESQKGNFTADVILSAVSQLTQTAGEIDAKLTDIKQVLLQIVNASNIPQVDDRDYYTRMHDYLEKESAEKHNTLASKILNVNEKTTISEVQLIKEQLVQAANESNTTALPQLVSAVNDYARTQQLRSVVKKIVEPTDSLSKSEKENLTKIHDSLAKESAKGNSLASSLLSVSDKTSITELKQLQDRLVEAGKKGEPIASSIIAQTSIPVSFSSLKRIQEVTPQEYEEVRNLWQKAYNQYIVPPGFTEDVKGRSEWINKDISDIEETVNMLHSTDANTKNKGIEKVSSILPFLLLGGYSFNEINSYLQIKLEAANYALKDLQQEEESQVSISSKKNISTPQTMSAAAHDKSDATSEETNELSSGQQSIVNPQATNEILSLVNIKLPTMSDIAQYELLSMSKDKSKSAEVQTMTQTLSNIGNPASVTNSTVREHYIKLREKLVEESKKGSVIAQAVLSATSGTNAAGVVVSPIDTKVVLSQIANPTLTTKTTDKDRFATLHDQLTEASTKGNTLAASLLSIKETATKEDIEKLTNQLNMEKAKGNELAASVLSNIASPVSLPATNRIQTVSAEDYKAVKDMWKENYQNLEVPQGLASSRSEWINNDVGKIDNIVSLLSSSDQEKVSRGMNEVSSILPFLLVGGFSQTEIVSYLQAKQEAGREVSAKLMQDEEGKVPIMVKKVATAPQTMTASAQSDSDLSNLSVIQSSDMAKSASNELLKSINVNIPTIAEIAKYEVASISKDKEKSSEVARIQESLGNIINPTAISIPVEREKFQKLQERLTSQSREQDVFASSILNAAAAVSQKTFNLSGDQIKNVFLKVVNPAAADSEGERKRMEELRNMLDKDARENNNKLAQAMLSVNEKTTIPELEKIRDDIKKSQNEGSRLANNIVWTLNKSILSAQTFEKAKKIFTQIANPSLVTDPVARSRFAKAHDVLLKASLSKNHLANTILSASEKSTDTEIDRMIEEVNTGKINNDPVALEVTTLMGFQSPVSLPAVNNIQKVGDTDYQSVKQIWKDSYKNLDIPEGMGANRIDWIKKDIANIDIITDQLKSQDKEQVEKGMDEVSNILPFILVGGFSQGEIVSYLKAKQDAAKESLDFLSKDEEEKVDVSPKKDEIAKDMSAEQEIPDTEKEK